MRRGLLLVGIGAGLGLAFAACDFGGEYDLYCKNHPGACDGGVAGGGSAGGGMVGGGSGGGAVGGGGGSGGGGAVGGGAGGGALGGGSGGGGGTGGGGAVGGGTGGGGAVGGGTGGGGGALGGGAGGGGATGGGTGGGSAACMSGVGEANVLVGNPVATGPRCFDVQLSAMAADMEGFTMGGDLSWLPINGGLLDPALAPSGTTCGMSFMPLMVAGSSCGDLALDVGYWGSFSGVADLSSSPPLDSGTVVIDAPAFLKVEMVSNLLPGQCVVARLTSIDDAGFDWPAAHSEPFISPASLSSYCGPLTTTYWSSGGQQLIVTFAYDGGTVVFNVAHAVPLDVGQAGMLPNKGDAGLGLDCVEHRCDPGSACGWKGLCCHLPGDSCTLDTDCCVGSCNTTVCN